jgi:transposase
MPDWSLVHRELTRKGVTLVLLWQEDTAATPDGLQSSQVCEAYRQWAQQLDLVMRQRHQAGETLCVDDAGQTVPVVAPRTGEVHEASLFIAVLGASHSTYAEATWSQSLPDWLGSHGRAFEALGGVPQVLVPDHLQAAVNRPHRYAPARNRTSLDMAQHSGVAIVPASVARPRDKAKVEGGGQVVERWLLARLRNHTFFARGALHTALKDLKTALHQRPFKKLPGSRQSLVASLDHPALHPLPDNPSPYAAWKLVRVHIDDHVEVAGHDDSVPSALATHQREARISVPTGERFPKGKRVASHRRAPHKGRPTTVVAHMPKAHQHSAEWPPTRRMRWAEKTGEACARGVETLLASRPHPQHGFRSCLGLRRLGTRDGAERLEAACRRALAIGACSSKSIAASLTHDLDRQPLPKPPETAPPAVHHVNVRGPNYSHSKGDPPC